MDQNTLQLFGRQLAHWSETAVSQGRSPFRRIETEPLLLTAGGEFRPAIVFWINRDSCMAGGVLLLPPREAEEAAEMGRHCASALGLRHFVTWAAREVVFWEERGSALARHKSLPLPAASQTAAEDFHAALRIVMEELKILSVVGAVPPEQLSPYCLANLCHTVLDAALPPIEEGYRIARSEGLLEQPEATASLAFSKGLLTLLRLLALVFYDRLPSAVQPEGLERAMRFALDTLPPQLRLPLSAEENDIPLPAESAVRFHHLLRRLTQLQCGRDRQRAAQVVRILLDHHAQRLAAFPLEPAPLPAAGLTLLLNPAEPYPAGGAQTLEVASPPQLALLALLRELQGLPPAELQSGDLFGLSLPAPLAAIRGTLNAPEIPADAERRKLSAYLRTSWPARRFSLPRRTPRWAWVFIHLLGLAEKGADLDVVIPEEWLSTSYGEALRRLLAEEYLLRSLSRSPTGGLRLKLLRSQAPDSLTTVVGPDGPRQLPWGRLCAAHPVLFRLALNTPEPVYRLLEEELLQLPGEADWPTAAEHAIFRYTRSPLGAFLWEVVSGGLPLPPATTLRAGVLRHGLPLPAVDILEMLQRLPAEDTAKQTQAAFETELFRQLGYEPCATTGSGRRDRPPPSPPSGKKANSEELAARIRAEVFVDGLPSFPEQYLYDYYRPALRHYTFSGPLQICDEFFGRVTLRDRQGATVEVEGSESAQALQLASFTHPDEVELPVDPRLTAAILSRYLADLVNLHRELSRQCHLHLADRRSANAMAEEIWQSLPLPPEQLLPK